MRIVSFARSVPYDGVPHAGGEYYLRHLRVLIDAGHSVTVVAPDNVENRVGESRRPPQLDVVLVESTGSALLYYVDRFNIRFRVAVPPERFVRRVVSDPRVLRAVEAADLLEYQWTEYAYIHGRLRRSLRRRLPAVGVAHDVLAQKFAREALAPELSPTQRFVARAKALLVRQDETRMLSRMSEIITFSAKDAELLARALGERRITVIDPPLEPDGEDWLQPRQPEPGEVLFVGAFYRPENSDGARWLLDAVWPRVLKAVPDARLRLAGSGPRQDLLRHAEAYPSVEVTGYVDDLGPYYRSAAVVVVPLLSGAGVKFKTITAMLWNVPVVSTVIGAEGIGDATSALFVDVTAEPTQFADAIIGVLRDGGPARVVAERAREHALGLYGSERFVEVLGSLYAAAGGLRSR